MGSRTQATTAATDPRHFFGKRPTRSNLPPLRKAIPATQTTRSHRHPAEREPPFPNLDTENRAICVPGVGSTKPFSVLVIDKMLDLQLMFNGQYLPRYRYEKRSDSQRDLLDDAQSLAAHRQHH